MIEILTASVITVIVLLAIGQVDVSRVRLAQEVRREAPAQGALALAYMVKSLQQADRVELLSPTSIQFRQFIGADPAAPGALEDATLYHWGQYKLVDIDPADDGTMDTIALYISGCGTNNINERFTAQTLSIAYQDVAGAPPGGVEPPVQDHQDNNVLQISIDGRFITEVTLRGGAYTNVMTGLAPPDVSNPPAAC